jgi:hypothetical protein
MAVTAAAGDLLSSMRFSHMTGNFLAAVSAHHPLLSGQPELPRWLMEALQWAKAGEQQRKELQVQAEHFPAHLSERLQIAFCWCLLLPLLLFTVTGQLFY